MSIQKRIGRVFLMLLILPLITGAATIVWLTSDTLTFRQAFKKTLEA